MAQYPPAFDTNLRLYTQGDAELRGRRIERTNLTRPKSHNIEKQFKLAGLGFRLGAEASAGAIADMLWKSRHRTNYGRLFGTNLNIAGSSQKIALRWRAQL